MHKTNSLLKYAAIPIMLILLLAVLVQSTHHTKENIPQKEPIIKNTASNDSAAESLDTLTADLSKTKQKITEVTKDNELLKQQSSALIKQSEETQKLSDEIEELKRELQNNSKKNRDEPSTTSAAPINIVDDVSGSKDHSVVNLLTNTKSLAITATQTASDKKTVPYYTIPANATSVKDKLMTALVGRIPVKGTVTDPYPFKIVISDDNLAANGLRVPHLLQMIVSGYCEGDLNLVSVRGWITSLTFVFDDGMISSTTSNDNDIGNFTKSNSLGYLSDKFGNPFIRGKLITNAPSYLAGNIAIGAGVGAANAYAQSQTTSNNTVFGNSTSVTGSQSKFVLGQAASNAATEAQQWWHDREEQSFDAVYVSPVDDKGNYIEIAVNFAKEIHIDYDPNGRKLNYAHSSNRSHHGLD